MTDNFNESHYYEQEFNMLKDAHFQTSQKIISFFQFALLIFSAPIALLTSDKISNAILGIVFAVIGVIELFVIAYLSSLRVESLLYARQINKIRNIIYTNNLFAETNENICEKKIMFSQDKKPDYYDTNQFIYIVIVLGLFSAFYSSFGCYKLINTYANISTTCSFFISIAIGVAVLVAALLLHFIISLRSENGTDYYKRKIGIDIDGVLNLHEETFVEIFNKVNKKKKKLTLSDIKTLPVHDSGEISIEEEKRVFETLEYWKNQKVREDVNLILIQELRNKFGFEPYIFTWRSWKIRRDIKGKKVRCNIKRLTKKWLKTNEIYYKKIKFEQGNIDMPISLCSSKYRTRFFYARKFRLKYFIEDNAYNAEKLSHICEFVFLINHPYNENINCPYNVIRVNSWKEILEFVKKHN